MTTESKLFLSSVIGCAIAWPLSAAPQTIPQKFESLLVVRLTSHHLGEGAALSPDGETVAYVGAGNALHLLNVASREDHVVLEQVGPGLDVFSHPSFSPDGMRVAFGASGGTQYYRSEIYSVRTDGSNLTQLTVSGPLNADGKPGEFYDAPKYSPDGSQILIWRHDNDPSSRETDSAELISLTGARRSRITNGRPMFWSATGRAIFVARRQPDQDGKEVGTIIKVDLETGTSEPVIGLNEPVVGKLPEEDIFAVADNSKVGFARVQNAAASVMAPVPLPVRKRNDGSAATGRFGELRLVSMHFDRAARRALVHYRFGFDETFEIFRMQ